MMASDHQIIGSVKGGRSGSLYRVTWYPISGAIYVSYAGSSYVGKASFRETPCEKPRHGCTTSETRSAWKEASEVQQTLSDLNLRVSRICEGQKPPQWFSPELAFDFPERVGAGLVLAISHGSVVVRLWRSASPAPNEHEVGEVTFTNAGTQTSPRVVTTASVGRTERSVFSTQSGDLPMLLATVESGLLRPSGQDPTIAAIRRLGELRATEAIPLLRRALQHANVTVKTDAALALHQLGDPAGIEALRKFLSDERASVSVMRILAKIGNDESIALLQKAKAMGGQRMFNGSMTPVSEIVDNLLQDAHPNRFPRTARAASNTAQEHSGFWRRLFGG